MTKNELKKKQILCDAINVKFDEANQLFEAETLESMQMAQMCGGSTPGPAAIWPIIPVGWMVLEKLALLAGTASALNSIWQALVGDDKATPPSSSSSVNIQYDDKGNPKVIEIKGAVDSVITDKVKVYGVGNNEPAPTSIINGPSPT